MGRRLSFSELQLQRLQDAFAAYLERVHPGTRWVPVEPEAEDERDDGGVGGHGVNRDDDRTLLDALRPVGARAHHYAREQSGD